MGLHIGNYILIKITAEKINLLIPYFYSLILNKLERVNILTKVYIKRIGPFYESKSLKHFNPLVCLALSPLYYASDK